MTDKSSSSGAEALVHEKLRAAVVDGAAVLDSVYSLMQARAQLEHNYSKSLQRLSQHPFAFNGEERLPAYVYGYTTSRSSAF